MKNFKKYKSTYFKILYLIIFFSLSNNITKAQCGWTNQLVVNTGFDEAANQPIEPGRGNNNNVLDPNWRLINLPIMRDRQVIDEEPIELNQAFIITRHNDRWNNNNTGRSNPISATNTPAFNENNLNETQPFRFVREFCLKQTEEVEIDFSLKADDAARVSIYNETNEPIYQYTTINLEQNFYTVGNASDHRNFNNNEVSFNGWNYNETLILNEGKYTIEVELLNVHSTAMGFVLDGTITVNSGAEVLSNDINCCDVGTIGFIKYYDQNCNGSIDTEDEIQQGVTFSLMQGNRIIQEATTDGTGEAFFRNIPFGTYTIIEHNSSFYLSNAPNTITIDSTEESQYFTFLDCLEPNLDCCENQLNIESTHGTVMFSPARNRTINETLYSTVSRGFQIQQDANTPITELRVSIADIDFEYKYDQCASCNQNAALWGSIYGSDDMIGNSENGLHQNLQDYTTVTEYLEDNISQGIQQREIIWKNSSGVMCLTTEC